MANEVNIQVKTKGTAQAKKAFGEVEKSTSLLKKAAIGMGVAFGARQLGRQIGAAVNRAEEMNSAYAITEQIIKQTGGAANVTAGEIKRLSTEQSLLTGVDKALVTEGNNVLLTFKNLRDEAGAGNDVYTRTSKAMLDMSVVMGTDAKSAAVQLGKALNDPISNLGALGRAGVQFTDDQKGMIKALIESGDLLGAQKIILEEIESQFGGTAAASANATDKIGNAWKEIQEQLGNVLLPLLERIAPTIVAMASSVEPALISVGLGFQQVKRQSQGLIDVLDVALGPLKDFEDAWTSQDEVMFQVTRRLGEYIKKVRDGSEEANVFAGAFVDLQQKGDAYGGTLESLIEQTNIGNDALRSAILILLEGAEAYGLNATQVDTLRRKLLSLGPAGAAAVAGLEGVKREIGELVSTPLALQVRLIAPSRGTIRNLMINELNRLRREGILPATGF